MELINENAYKDAMERINFLMSKGSGNICEEERCEIDELAKAAQAFERDKFKLVQDS